MEKQDYKVVVYHETYTIYNVKANSKEEAEELVMEGERDDVDDVTDRCCRSNRYQCTNDSD